MDSYSMAAKIVAGGLAGVSETLITYPAEFCKTRRQLSVSRQTRPTSSFSILMSTIKTHGISGVYSGCKALAASNAAKSGIRFLTFETTRDALDQLSSTPKDSNIGRAPWINVLSGLSAGIAESILVVTPGESLKTKMIHDASHGGHRFAGQGLIGVAGIVFREEGIRGLWSGCLPVLFKQGTNSAVRFTTFAMLQEQVAVRWPGSENGLGSSLLLGAISGVITVYASMPFDNLKTRMQASSGQYSGVADCAMQTLKSEGALAFWKGTSPRLVRLILSSGITFAVYGQVTTAMKLLRDRAQTAGYPQEI